MSEYRLTPAAKSDLIEIWNYTIEVWGEKQAEKYLLDIKTKLEKLAGNPELGIQRPEVAPGYQSLPVGKHVIFYRQSGDYIEIVGILHGRMDIDKNLF